MPKVSANFKKAGNDDLPFVDHDMIFNYMETNISYRSAEIKGVKLTRASQPSYGETAIGYVQVCREEPICTVDARVTPEHRIHKKDYNVVARINEKDKTIDELKCHDCAAAEGGCKHAIALIFWLYRRSYDPSRTSVECYWKKSALSRVGRNESFPTVEEICGHAPIPLPIVPQTFFQEIVRYMKSENNVNNSMILRTGVLDKPNCIYHLMLKYGENSTPLTANSLDFINFCRGHMDMQECKLLESTKQDDNSSSQWAFARFGRITASRAYEASRCKTMEGSLSETIFGGSVPFSTPAVLRGKALEAEVLLELEKQVAISFSTCGIFLSPEAPIFGASPDAISKEMVVEIKCPYKMETVKNYVDNNVISKKPYAQIQLQMHLAKRKKGLFVVADPAFEQNKKIDIITVNYDKDFCDELMLNCSEYWQNAIFPKLKLMI